MRTFLGFLLRLLYGFRAFNEAGIDVPGPVLLLPNHVSWWDWLMLGVCLDNDWRFVTSSQTAKLSWFHRKVMVNRRTFPVDMNSPYAVKHIAEYLQKGGRLVMFPEGRLSRTGALMKLFDGTGFLIHKTNPKVITAYARGTQRLPFSPNPLRKKWFPRLSIHFSDPSAAPRLEGVTVTQARERLTAWVRDLMVKQRFEIEMELGPATIPDAILKAARRQPSRVVLQDATMQSLTYRRLVLGADLLSRQWMRTFAESLPREHPSDEPDGSLSPRRRSGGRAGEGGATERANCDLSPDEPRHAYSQEASSPQPSPPKEEREKTLASERHGGAVEQTSVANTRPRVGVLLPNVNAMPVVLLSLWAANRVPVVLNYSSGPATLLVCARLAGLQHIITSKTFLSRLGLDPEPFRHAGIELIFLEDARARISTLQKVKAMLRQFFKPSLSTINYPLPTSTALILFTSGSEGEPKGVELTHRNLLANIRQMLALIDLMETDRVFNALPLFHSFGLTVGLLLPLSEGVFTFLYVSPLHYRVVPSAFYNLDCTVFFGTNTFLAGYARKAHPYDFRSLRYLFAGAEKVQESTSNLWMRKFGVRILEGYGVTECSPCLSVNLPLQPRHGSAGRFLPGIEFKLEAVEGVTDDGKSEIRNTEADLTPVPPLHRMERGPGGEARADAPPPPPSPLPMGWGGGQPAGESALRTPPSALPQAGRLLVRGPNIMRGYLNPEANAKFQALGGWYDTGDIVRIDEEGFIHILGRLKRFAKISGEMVSLAAVEEALAGAFPQYGLRFAVAVLARRDETKGERLIAVTNEPKLRLEQIREAIRARGLSNLAVPRELRLIHDLPLLGTGKLNYRELERLI